jgi:hypothetical protein
MADDLAIPPPRTAHDWYCWDCGEPGGTPDPGYLAIDGRYVPGLHACVKAVKQVFLVADFHFSRAEWTEVQQAKAEKRAFEKGVRGSPLTPEEIRMAARFRARAGLAPLDDKPL